MSRNDVITRIKKYEQFADNNPRLYKVGVVLFALLAYFFIALIVVIALSLSLLILAMLLTGKIIVLKLLFPLAILLYGIFRSLWVKFEPPQGLTLNRNEVPELFKTLDQTTQILKSPKIHQVLINDDFNAAIVQHPRLGILGWYKNYLLLGYPLMQAVSPEQFEAVLAHELGHVSRSHGRIGSWIYRIQRTWLQLADYFQQNQHWSNAVIRGFFNWFYPRFDMYSFVLRRRHEYEADQASALVIGSRFAAEALVNIDLKHAFLSKEFWPGIYRRADETCLMPNPYAELQKSLISSNQSPKISIWLQDSIADESDYYGVHPSLKDRLAALGETARVPDPYQRSAAEFFLGPKCDALTKAFDLKWLNDYKADWKAHFETTQKERTQLQELTHKKDGGKELEADEMMDYAWLTEKYTSKDEALPYYQTALQKNPDLAIASYHIGRILLNKPESESDGIQHIQQAIAADQDLIIPGNRLLFEYYMSKHLPDEADRCYQKANEYSRLLALAQEERQVFLDKNYIEHGLPADEVLTLAEELRQFPELKEAFLVRRKVKYLPERPMYVMCITHIGGQNDPPLRSRIANTVNFSGEMYVIDLNWEHRELKFVHKIKGSLIYRKG